MRDTSGAAAPDATIVITHEDSKATRTLTTDASGRYTAIGFFVGSYQVQATKGGFAPAIVTGVQVRPGAVSPVDLVLSVGSLSDSVEVTTTAPVIQSESSDHSYALDPSAFGRHELQSSAMYMIPFTAVAWSSAHASGANALLTFRGGPQDYTALSVEGVTGKGQNLRLPSKAQRSAEVVSFDSPAEYNRAVTANVTVQSGTNDFHGEFETHFQNPRLNAVHTPFFQGAAPAGVSTWRYNATFGGPVYIPKLYNGKNRTFFFGAWQRNRPSSVLYLNQLSAPTAAMREGDFSAYSKTIVDPLTKTPYPGNVIPASLISPVATAAAADFYRNFRYVGNPNSTAGNMVAYLPYADNLRSTLVKIDHHFGNGDALNGYFSRTPLTRHAATPEMWTDDNMYWIASIAHTHVFRPSLINEMRAGYTRNTDARGKAREDGSFGPQTGADALASLGLQGLTAPDNSFRGQPQFSFSGVWPQFRPFNQTKNIATFVTFYDNVTYIKGRHEIKAGFSTRRLLQDSAATGNVFGSFSFNGSYSGDPYSDFLLGIPFSSGRTALRPWISARRQEYGGFLQDKFRISSKLTLSAGLRYDMYTAPVDRNGLFYNFDLQNLSLVVPDPFARDHVSPQWPLGSVPVRLASEAGYPSKLVNANGKFTPRLGLAWRPTSDWVFRAGYGLYMGLMAFTELQTGGPFQTNETFNNAVVDGRFLFTFPNPFPQGATASQIGVTNAAGFDPNFRSGYIQNWNIGTEKSIFRNWGVRVAYLGHKVTNMPFSYNANTPTLSTLPFTAQRRPVPQFNTLTYTTNGGNDLYQAFELNLNRPMRRGLALQFGYSYNWNRSDVHSSNALEAQQAPMIDYAYDRARDRGRNASWPAHDIVANFVYEFPFKKTSKGNRFLRAAFGDWAVSGYLNWHTGNFFTPTYSSSDPGGINQFSGRANVVPGCDPYEGGRNLGANAMWFNPKCFSIPQPGTLGNAAINSLTGPNMLATALNPYKEFPITERIVLRLGAQIDNILNHPQYAVPNAVIDGPNAGRIVGMQQTRRSYEGSLNGRNMLLLASIRF